MTSAVLSGSSRLPVVMPAGAPPLSTGVAGHCGPATSDGRSRDLEGTSDVAETLAAAAPLEFAAQIDADATISEVG